MRWIVIYPVDSAIQRLNNWGQAEVVLTLDSAIQRLNNRGQVCKLVWKMTFFCCERESGFGEPRRAAHPHQDLPVVPTRGVETERE